MVAAVGILVNSDHRIAGNFNPSGVLPSSVINRAREPASYGGP